MLMAALVISNAPKHLYTLQITPYFEQSHPDVFFDTRMENHGYVLSQITVWDQISTNGVVHTIEGLPCIATEKIEDYLARQAQFS